MEYQYDDGGRKAAGYKGVASDCLCRALAIATQKPYKEIYDFINSFGTSERRSRKRTSKSTARGGVYGATARRIAAALGMTWTPTMKIGQGRKTHLRADELPSGRIVAVLSGHYCAVVDGVIHDTFDPSREGTRCVYGYFTPTEGEAHP